MHRYNKGKKKGFSLLEMVLVIAIVVLIGGVIAGVCAAISNSFITTYNIDESADYAMLYSRGFENSFLAITQSDGASGNVWKWWIENPRGLSGKIPTLMYEKPDGTKDAVFNPHFMTSSDPGDNNKWGVSMFYYYDSANECVLYRIFIKDNYDNTGYVNRYDGSFWVPRFMERAEKAGVDGGRRVDLYGNQLSETTMKNVYGYTQDEVNQIANAWDNNYKDGIQFTWG